MLRSQFYRSGFPISSLRLSAPADQFSFLVMSRSGSHCPFSAISSRSALTKTRNSTGDVEKRPPVKGCEGQGWRVKQDADETETRGTRETSASCALLARRCCRHVLARAVHSRFLPNRVLLRASSEVPATAGMPPVGGKAAAYVCQNFTCQLPLTDPDALARALLNSATRQFNL